MFLTKIINHPTILILNLNLASMALIFMISGKTNAQEKIILNEPMLIEMIEKNSPDVKMLEAINMASQIEVEKSENQFKAEIFARKSVEETSQKPIIQFQPVFTPIHQNLLGVRQNFRKGIGLQAYGSTDQRNANSPFAGKFENVTTNTFAVGVTVDLWKDFWGKLTSTQLESIELQKEKNKLENVIAKKQINLNLRRIYWSLVANNESLLISQELLKTAESQAKEAQRRLNASIADEGELASYQAQVASRKGNILYLQYQREQLIKQLRSMIPDLQTKSIELTGYNLEQSISEVLACTHLISQQEKTPFDYTQYDEVISMLNKVKNGQIKIAESYDQMDLKLSGEVKATGVSSEKDGNKSLYEGSHQDAMEDIYDNTRSGYKIGLDLVIPFGKSSTKDSLQIYEENKSTAQLDKMMSNIKSTHQQLATSVVLLTEVIKTQKENNLALEKRLKIMNRKFREARVNTFELIQDQDALMSSSLTVIQTKLEIVNTLLDYLVIFNQTPCEFNKI